MYHGHNPKRDLIEPACIEALRAEGFRVERMTNLFDLFIAAPNNRVCAIEIKDPGADYSPKQKKDRDGTNKDKQNWTGAIHRAESPEESVMIAYRETGWINPRDQLIQAVVDFDKHFGLSEGQFDDWESGEGSLIGKYGCT